MDENKDTTLLKPIQLYDGMVNNPSLEMLQDGKYNKYYTMSTNQLTVDLGSPQQLTHIELIPRSNTNGIIPGYQYELFYWTEKEGWKSLGKQTAANWYLEYKQVPANALLWLKCHNSGKKKEYSPTKTEDRGGGNLLKVDG